MAWSAARPLEIRRVGTAAVQIDWSDGHRSEYSNRDLRHACPCAECRERRPPKESADAVPVHPTEIQLVGRYALQFRWSDGHDTGIYTFQSLRAACPCAECRAREEGKGTG